GTCASAGLAAIGKPREAVRAAVAHAVFKILGVAVWVGFLPQLAEWVRLLSPAAPHLTGLDRVAAEAPRQIANAHTLFNVANTLIFAPFTAQIARLVERLVPDRPLADAARIRPRFIDPTFLFTPGFALDRAQLEIERLGRMVTDLVRQVMDPLLVGDAAGMRALAEVDERVDDLHAAIVDYLGQVSTQTLTKDETAKLTRLMRQANELEQIGDVVEHDVLHTGQRMVDERVRISPATEELLRTFHAMVVEALESAMVALRDDDKGQRKQVKQMKDDVRALEDVVARHQIDRLTADEPNRLHTFKRETELFEQLGNIFSLTRRLLRRVG
ncbi:MAG: Na/Pi cotransporter family protein, partial [Myxococcales bacterium]|nr:Na/Pi cotransporter family protein [Myxococcales bacterium]